MTRFPLRRLNEKHRASFVQLHPLLLPRFHTIDGITHFIRRMSSLVYARLPRSINVDGECSRHFGLPLVYFRNWRREGLIQSTSLLVSWGRSCDKSFGLASSMGHGCVDCTGSQFLYRIQIDEHHKLFGTSQELSSLM